MKIVIILFFVVLLSAQSSFKKSSGSYSNGALGATLSYIKPDLSDLNKSLKNLDVGKLKEDIFLFGGEVSGALNSSVFVGAQYFSGSTSTSGSVVREINTETYKLSRSIKYDLSYGGISGSYYSSVMGSTGYFVGGSVNYGSVRLLLSQDAGDLTYDDLINSYDHPNLFHSSTLKCDMWAFEAFSGLRMALSDNIFLQLSVGYLYAFVDEDGVLNYEFENVMDGVPDLDINSVRYSASVMFGN
ncbi:MAG: hypothetical protein JXR48_04750 [Candidatus Delongbacteria bacterium]|nr:hypothetical protein [Candidatus Delongbacteria bacterium]MBN2834257.1 hypothetical protein [Candidatus Delongbacteria bacterium]